MKSLVSFLLGALVATLFWFFMGYLQVDGNKMEKHLHNGQPTVEQLTDEPEPITEESATQADENAPQATAQPSIVGRWRIADPVGHDEQNRMLQIDEYGNIKDFYSVSLGFSNDYTYIVEGNIIKYGSSSRFYGYSFQFNLRRENGKDYLEIYNDTNFGGKWVRSK